MNGERWLADDLVDPDVYAKGVDEGWTDTELYRLIVRQLQRSFHSGTEADRRTMLANRPHLTNTKWDAALAAVIEHVALTHGYDAPAWVDEPERFLPEPVKLTGFETDSDLAWQLGAFLRRGVSIDSRDLDGRTGPARRPLTSLRSLPTRAKLSRFCPEARRDPDVVDAGTVTPLHYAAGWRPAAASADRATIKGQADGRDSLERRAGNTVRSRCLRPRARRGTCHPRDGPDAPNEGPLTQR